MLLLTAEELVVPDEGGTSKECTFNPPSLPGAICWLKVIKR